MYHGMVGRLALPHVLQLLCCRNDNTSFGIQRHLAAIQGQRSLGQQLSTYGEQVGLYCCQDRLERTLVVSASLFSRY